MSKNKAAIARAALEREALEHRKNEERQEKRERRTRAAKQSAKSSIAAGDDQRGALTFGQVVNRLGLLEKISGVTRDIVSKTVVGADEFAKKSLRVVSCHSCTAPKGCCKISTLAYLYEVVPLTASLIKEGRDTPELRARLTVAADAMENTPKQSYGMPCVFLDERERCSVYEYRPSVCGTHLVFSDPILCSSDGFDARYESMRSPFLIKYQPRFEQRFATDVKLRKLRVPYMGALPRMILLCLQAWDRNDYIDFIAEQCEPTTLSFLQAISG